MTDWVFDSCVAARWVLDEPDSADAERAAADVNAAGRTLYTLDLAPVEVANALRTRVRRGLLTPAEAADQYVQFQQRPTTLLPALQLVPAALAIGIRYNIAVYDALFVAAVQHLGCGGVTADEPLVKAVAADFPQIKLLRHW